MKGISINGKKLHEIMLPLQPYNNCNSVVSQCYPKNRIIFDQQEGGILSLTLPSKLALEMYRVGVFPQDGNESFPVSISGKSVGNYTVEAFVYPNSSVHDDVVYITLYSQKTC
jgi:hypothetical protein